MGSEWKEFTLEEIASKEKSALATGPFGSAISSKFFQEDGVPVIRGGNLSADTSNRMSDEGLVFVSKDKAMEFKRSVVKAGDLIFTCWGTINQVGLLDESRKFEQYIISNKQMKVTLDSNKADPLFVYYVFSSPKKQNEILKNGIGAAVPGFNLGQLREHKLWLPSVSEQQKISSFLDCFDKKISLNNQINQNLEQMAQTLFKSWFVDYDPVIDNALDAGNDIPEVFETRVERRKAVRESADFKPLPDDVRQLFPSEFEESELGWVPKGWIVSPLSKVAKVSSGKRPPIKSTEKTLTETVPVWGGNGIKWYTSESLYYQKYIITGRVGTLGTVYKVDGSSWASDNALVIEPVRESLYEFVYQTLKNFDIASLNSGSTQPLVTQSALKKSVFVTSDNQKLEQVFQELAQSYDDKKYCLEGESKSLTKLRNTLLPKLISGELRLDSPEVEQAKALVE